MNVKIPNLQKPKTGAPAISKSFRTRDTRPSSVAYAYLWKAEKVNEAGEKVKKVMWKIPSDP